MPAAVDIPPAVPAPFTAEQAPSNPAAFDLSPLPLVPTSPAVPFVSVLYVFAGKARKSDVGDQLRQLHAEGTINLQLSELDLLRDEDHNVLNASCWTPVKQAMEAGDFQVLIMTPPCNTHSRARYANSQGPAPLRSKQWPRGFPWLEGKRLEEVQLSNELVDMTIASCRIMHKVGGAYLVEHPEDLGATPSEDQPASIFATEEVFSLVEDTGGETAAFYQCPFGAPSSKPTRVISTLRLVDPPNFKLCRGWPKFDKKGFYKGPLKRGCGHRHKGLLGRATPDGPFRTAAAASYPPNMCTWIVYMILLFCSHHPRQLPKDGRMETKQQQNVVADPPGEDEIAPPVPSSPLPCPSSVTAGKLVKQPDARERYVIEPGDETSEEEDPGVLKPKLENHLPGVGPPLSTRWAGRTKPFHDGAGLCSAGRWHPDRRTPNPWPSVFSLRMKWLKILKEEFGDPRRLVFSLACAHSPSSPFSDALVQKGRDAWIEELSKSSSSPPELLREVVPNQPFLLRAVGETLKGMKDPDFRIFAEAQRECFSTGVSVGPGRRLPRTPAVFERKVRWRAYEDSEFSGDNKNYQSAAGPHMTNVLRQQFVEEESMGLMYRTTLAEATLEFPGDRLRIASQGAIEKDDDSFRILHDASHGVLVNHQTRVRDQIRCPSAAEARTIMELCDSDRPGDVQFTLLGDIKKAHRRFLHRQEDHGLMACRPGPDLDEVWINRTGTFGFSTASYWWGRLAGGIARMVVNFFSNSWFFQLLYADDLRIQTGGKDKFWNLLLGYFIWSLTGAPFSWKKARGGLKSEWIGYFVDYARFEIGVSESRCRWLIQWGSKIIADNLVLIRALAEGLGRLGYCAGILEWCRPFLAPLYSWCAAAPSGAVLPLPPLIRLTLSFIVGQLREGKAMTCCRAPCGDQGEIFRTDASATEDTVTLGGWECRNSTPPDRARWYSVRLSAAEAPWLFARGHASRTVASSELLGTLVAVQLFCPIETRPTTGLMRCTGATDNAGNSYVVAKLMTTKYPLAPILMELTAALALRGLWLNLEWVPRELNTQADELTNSNYSSFKEEHRMEVVWSKLPFGIMSALLDEGLKFEAELKERKRLNLEQPPSFKRRRRAKDKTPWSA